MLCTAGKVQPSPVTDMVLAAVQSGWLWLVNVTLGTGLHLYYKPNLALLGLSPYNGFMDGIWAWLAPLLGGLILWGIIDSAVKAPGRALAGKFAGLGNMKGVSLEDISAVVGPPQGRSASADGGEVVQWLQSGYHIALIFKDGICQGVSHEFLAK